MRHHLPILQGPVTFARFRVEQLEADPELRPSILAALRDRAFRPIDLKEPADRVAGFVELEERDGVEFARDSVFHGERALFSYRIDEVKIDASTVRDALERWRKEFEKTEGRLPGRREKNDAKGEIRFTLRLRSPIKAKTHDVSWDLDSAEIHVWSASRNAIDEVQDAVEQAFAVKLIPIVPITVAGLLGIDERTLTPTAALSLPEVARG